MSSTNFFLRRLLIGILLSTQPTPRVLNYFSQQTDLRGRGKVYTGSQFRSEGMVDRKGGFIEAFRDFRKEAGFGEQMFDIQIFPVLRPGAADLIRQGPFSAMRPLEKSELFQSKNLYMVHPDICFQHTGFQTELRRAGGSLIGSAILRL